MYALIHFSLEGEVSFILQLKKCYNCKDDLRKGKKSR